MQFVTVLGLLIFGLVFSAQMVSRQRRLWRENVDLRDEINCMRERREESLKRLTDEQGRHRKLLSKIGDDIYDVHPLLPADFDCVRQLGSSKPLRVSLDASHADDLMPPQSSNDSRYLEKGSTAEPALISATVSDISGQHMDLEGPVDDSIDDDSDPLTRALKISKAIGR